MRITIAFILGLVLWFSGCRKTPEPTPEPKPEAKPKVQSFASPQYIDRRVDHDSPKPCNFSMSVPPVRNS